MAERIPAHKLRPGDVIVMGGEHGGTERHETVERVVLKRGVEVVYFMSGRSEHFVEHDHTFTVIERGPE